VFGIGNGSDPLSIKNSSPDQGLTNGKCSVLLIQSESEGAERTARRWKGPVSTQPYPARDRVLKLTSETAIY
jgi:hypothetical protein